jgi:hypothetical protein
MRNTFIIAVALVTLMGMPSSKAPAGSSKAPAQVVIPSEDDDWGMPKGAPEPKKSPQSKSPATNSENLEISNLGTDAMDAKSLDVVSLRPEFCGGHSLVDQNAKNATFAACLRYVLGAVDMLREWQRVDPANAPSACVPRIITAGFLISVIQEHIEATAPWHQAQFDASPAIIAALAAKWPCQRVR